MKPSDYHEGEIAIQERLGVRTKAERVGSIIHATVPVQARIFLEEQTTAVICVVSNEQPLLVPLTGPPGFVTTDSDSTIRFHGAFDARLPIPAGTDTPAGTVIMDFEGRRRMRANGRAHRDGSDLVIDVDQAYANCPRFIRPRRWEATRNIADERPTSARRLAASQSQLITGADTFFIGTFHPTAGADASHRGGEPGFVSVDDPGTLSWPDYAGNNMLNTLGNLEVEPRCALLFVDFDRGHVLQLIGRARLEIDSHDGRRIRFAIDSAVDTRGALAARWHIVSESNPRRWAK